MRPAPVSACRSQTTVSTHLRDEQGPQAGATTPAEQSQQDNNAGHIKRHGDAEVDVSRYWDDAAGEDLWDVDASSLTPTLELRQGKDYVDEPEPRLLGSDLKTARTFPTYHV